MNIQGSKKEGRVVECTAAMPAIDKPSLPPLLLCSFPFLLSPTFISKSLSPAPHDAVVRPDESFQLVYCLCHPLNGELGPLPPPSAVPLPFLPTAPLGASLSVPRLSPRKRRTKILLPPSISILNRQRQFSRVEPRGRSKVKLGASKEVACARFPSPTDYCFRRRVP